MYACRSVMSPDHEKRLKELREGAQKLLTADYFTVLSVARTASPEEVKKAFVEAAKSWHPDRLPQGMEEVRPLFSKLFARLEAARATLTDPGRRVRYLEELSKPVTAATAGDLSSAEATLEFRKAEVLLKKNDAAGAENHLRRAVSLAPGNVEYQVLLVWLQVKPDTPVVRLRALVAELDALIARATSERAYLYRGQLRKRLDLLKEANADFVRAAELNPNNVDAAREIRIFKMRQDKSGAPALATNKSPSDPDAGVGGFFKKLFKR